MCAILFSCPEKYVHAEAKRGGTAGLGSTSPGGRSRKKGSVKDQLRLDEESRLKAKREALEEQRLLVLRTGSLYDFINTPRPVCVYE